MKPEFYLRLKSLHDLVTYSPASILLRTAIETDDCIVPVLFSFHSLGSGDKLFVMYYKGRDWIETHGVNSLNFKYVRHDMTNDEIELRNKFEVEGGDIRYVPMIDAEFDGFELEFKVGEGIESD